MSKVVKCSKCRETLPEQLWNSQQLERCPKCKTKILVDVFPAINKKLQPILASEMLLAEGDASCFYHAKKRAKVPCGSCGRFLCALCDIELSDSHICPPCLEKGRKADNIELLVSSRPLYDSIALALSFWPLLMWPFTFVTAPMAMHMSFKHWNTTTSLVPRNRKIRFLFAMLFSGLQIAGWLTLIGFGIVALVS